MKNLILIFLFLLLTASLFQVSVLPLPLGVLVILTWYLLKGTRDIVILAVFFSVVLANLTNIPSYLILLSSTLSIGFLAFTKQFSPSKMPITFVIWVGVW
jgi:hypothetical protein